MCDNCDAKVTLMIVPAALSHHGLYCAILRILVDTAGTEASCKLLNHI